MIISQGSKVIVLHTGRSPKSTFPTKPPSRSIGKLTVDETLLKVSSYKLQEPKKQKNLKQDEWNESTNRATINLRPLLSKRQWNSDFGFLTSFFRPTTYNLYKVRSPRFLRARNDRITTKHHANTSHSFANSLPCSQPSSCPEIPEIKDQMNHKRSTVLNLPQKKTKD